MGGRQTADSRERTADGRIADVDVTRKLADFVADTPSAAIGTKACEQAKRAFLDTIGVTLAGCREEGPGIVAAMVRDQGGAEEATVFGAGFRAPATQAALANGTAAHALDYDDVTVNMRGHPSVPLVPALLALGEKLGSNGSDVLDAYVLGFEVECNLGRAIGGLHYALGWHATSTLGTVGAAAACARLLRLDAEGTRNALGIAASLASGLQQNFGTMTKPLHAGWAAHNGLLAAELACRGFGSDAQALEGPSGFLRAMSAGREIDAVEAVRGFGEPWEVVEPGIGVKLYPCCYATHRSIDAAREVRGHPGFDMRSIDKVELHLSKGTLVPLIARVPETGLEAKFSLEYCVAAALLDGALKLASFTDGAALRSDVRGLAARVEAVEDGPALAYPIEGWARAVVQMRDAGAFEAEVSAPRGDPKNPPSWGELEGKFRDCAAIALDEAEIETALGAVKSMDEQGSLGDLTGALSRSCL